jgi:Protein of unknown function (DUF2370)
MSAHYAPIPSRSAPDVERELNDAFESLSDQDDNDNDNDNDGNGNEENALLNHRHSFHLSSSEDTSNVIPGTYDFEREYDFPPPGSPPGPSSRALPNDYGNSNGLLPTSPVRITQKTAGPSFFRRAVGALLPSHYVRVPTEAQSSRTVGGGMDNDGVFANVMAKPQRSQVIHTEDGDVYVVPEDSNQKDIPPVISYLADAISPSSYQSLSLMQMPKLTLSLLTGKPPSTHPHHATQTPT